MLAFTQNASKNQLLGTLPWFSFQTDLYGKYLFTKSQKEVISYSFLNLYTKCFKSFHIRCKKFMTKYTLITQHNN